MGQRGMGIKARPDETKMIEAGGGEEDEAPREVRCGRKAVAVARGER